MSDSPAVTVRSATLDDLDVLIEFVKAMAVDSEGVTLDDATVTVGVRTMLERSELGGYIIAEADGKPVGSLMIQYEWSDWRARRVIWIHSVYVHADARRRGVFRTMYEYLKTRVQNDDTLAGLRLYVDKTNPRAIVAYEACGMSCDHYHLHEWLDPSMDLKNR